jgi:hypothetical protein
MSPDSLRKELRRQPFVPLRLYLTDGTSYEVRHPEMVLVSQREVYIGTETEPGSGVAAKTDLVSLLHIVRVEQLTKPQPPVGTN